MNKIAIFVEGQTEQLFVERLIRKIAERKNVYIEKRKGFGGRNSKRVWRMTMSRGSHDAKRSEYYAMVVDCGGDTRVASDIREQYHGLLREGFQSIIGIRDVYPEIRHDEVDLLRRGLRRVLPRRPLRVDVVLSVMEVEAWFLAEASHFNRMHQRLSIDFIKKKLKIDLSNDDISAYPHPAATLNDIYQLVGMNYTKRRSNTRRTLDALDFTRMVEELPGKIEDLNLLIDRLEAFLN